MGSNATTTLLSKITAKGRKNCPQQPRYSFPKGTQTRVSPRNGEHVIDPAVGSFLAINNGTASLGPGQTPPAPQEILPLLSSPALRLLPPSPAHKPEVKSPLPEVLASGCFRLNMISPCEFESCCSRSDGLDWGGTLAFSCHGFFQDLMLVFHCCRLSMFSVQEWLMLKT
jgi:hypothetical protein